MDSFGLKDSQDPSEARLGNYHRRLWNDGRKVVVMKGSAAVSGNPATGIMLLRVGLASRPGTYLGSESLFGADQKRGSQVETKVGDEHEQS